MKFGDPYLPIQILREKDEGEKGRKKEKKKKEKVFS